mmetsp:Transcript_11728/g.27514  ORF Transcript_11728/g.27514 Transcript_11728/m.27514 type:complete len:289 (+) Transcript_11728:88-954(+)
MSSSDSDSDSESDRDETDAAVMDMELLKAFRKKPLSRVRKGSGEASESDEEGTDADEDGGGSDDSEVGEESSDGGSRNDDSEEGGEEDEEGEEEEMGQEMVDEEDRLEIRQLVGPHGLPLFVCKLCPSRGPFKTIAQTKEFMNGKFYLGVLKKTMRENRKSAKEKKIIAAADRPDSVNEEWKKKHREKQAQKRERLATMKAEKRKKQTSALSEEQIQKRKERFQLKKARRLAAKGLTKTDTASSSPSKKPREAEQGGEETEEPTPKKRRDLKLKSKKGPRPPAFDNRI